MNSGWDQQYDIDTQPNGANMNTPTPFHYGFPRLTDKLNQMRAAELADDLDSFLVEAKDDPDIRPMLVHAAQLAMAIRQYAKR